MFLQVLLGGAIGIASGMRHAIEPDHLAAVSTFVAEAPSPRRAVRFAAAWGTGHALMLLIVGGALVVTRREMPALLVDAFELLVAAALVFLGVRALVRMRAARAARDHRHPLTHADHGHGALARPLFVGVLHGLAGSGAITALALSSLDSASHGLAFVALYGFGATLGMAALAGLAGPPLARITRSAPMWMALVGVTGGISLLMGVVWAAQAISRLLSA